MTDTTTATALDALMQENDELRDRLTESEKNRQMGIESLHRLRNRTEEQGRQLVDLAQGLKQIVLALTHGTPEPRNKVNISYVAGYTRAMDDMKRAILNAAKLVPPEADAPKEITE